MREYGAEVVRVDAYATEIITEPDLDRLTLVDKGGIGAVMLASPSAVEGFVGQMGSLLPAMSGASFVAIGRIRPEPVVVEDEVVVRRRVAIVYTIDERVTDGFYLVRSADLLQEMFDDPESLLRPLTHG